MRATHCTRASFWIVTATALLCVAQSAMGWTWQIETVCAPVSSDGGTCVVLDNEYRPRIAYVSSDRRQLMHAAWTGTSWSIEAVGGLAGYVRWPSLKVGRDDCSRIAYHAYYTTPYQTVRYAVQDEGQWATVDIDGPSSGFVPSLALDENDLPRISYSNAAGGNIDSIKFATYQGGDWERQWVLGNVGACSTSLALDSAGNPKVAYAASPNTLGYAVWNGASWDHQTLDGASWVGWDPPPAMVLDAANNPHILYCDDVSRRTGDPYAADALKYAHWDGSSWHIETVDDYVLNDCGLALRIGSDGRPRIAYGDWGRAIKYTTGQWDEMSQSWEWETQTVGGELGSGISMALDAHDHPWISYFRGADLNNLKLAYVPEPTTLLMLGLGGLALVRRRRE